ncbi:DUF6600 domain-containing protein [Desulfobacula sp.]|uniref:DUF6600 domain-containing protein n=1 Tax=Desulfobacula sp. TaxID=2593537 RepID=UPI0025C09056|nr:DUF6600 domain-containing protein [Desulfobacula sp.]MBC2705851.1 FecR domain-containing protein [Desulfobacula sp.]
MKKIICLVTLFILFTSAVVFSKDAAFVGRITRIEGNELLRYVEEKQDWISLIEDSPFGVNDLISSSEKTRVEIIIPNYTLLRMRENTQVRVERLGANVTSIHLLSGTARFQSSDFQTEIEVITPFGTAHSSDKVVFDVTVGENSAEFIALKGRLDFVHNSGDTEYEVLAGSSALMADDIGISTSEPLLNVNWNNWNYMRENIWQSRLSSQESRKYLPNNLTYEAYALDKNGIWENVYYRGRHHRFWRPTAIAVGWSPYSIGHWTLWNGDQCWIPAEPFGYVTHHYGSWLFTSGRWYWTPPIVSVSLSSVGISFGWYPGRVSWVSSGIYIGWYPLAWYERYYSHRHWGRYSHRFPKQPRYNLHRSHVNYAHAIIIARNQLYRHRDYRKVRLHNIQRDQIKARYRSVGRIHDIRKIKKDRKRHHFSNSPPRIRPHYSALEKVKTQRQQKRISITKTKDLKKRALVKRTHISQPIIPPRMGQVKKKHRQPIKIQKARSPQPRKIQKAQLTRPIKVQKKRLTQSRKIHEARLMQQRKIQKSQSAQPRKIHKGRLMQQREPINHGQEKQKRGWKGYRLTSKNGFGAGRE